MAHHDNPAHYGVRTDRYKLIFFYGLALDAAGAVDVKTQPGWELYDLKEDPTESRNVYGKPEFADVTRQIKQQLLDLKREVGDTDERYPELMSISQQYWDK